ncbi:MAG: DUF1700 domain-containing protein [Lachnospiraceae bacterium]|nr:DUF1700 domain-containing protein [Lachnospiraceae bacterium]
MNRTEYIKELSRRLKYIPGEDREDAIEYYNELMSDMGIGEADDVSEKLENPKDAAKKILEECTKKHVDEYEENKTAKGRATIAWLYVLGALSLPLSLPLAIVVLVLAFALVIVIASLFISFAATAVALVAAGLASFVFMWTAPGIAQKMVIFGMGITSLALGVLIGFGIYYGARALIRVTFRRKRSKTEETIQ